MIRGEVTLVLRDVTTGKITNEITESNVITDNGLSRMAHTANDLAPDNQIALGHRIMISDSTTPHDRDEPFITGTHEIGYVESGITSPLNDQTNLPYFTQNQNRFNPPAVDRNINTVALYDTATTIVPADTQKVNCYLKLNTTCIQTTSETLDVFYRIIFDNDKAITGMDDYTKLSAIQQKQGGYDSGAEDGTTGDYWFGSKFPSYARGVSYISSVHDSAEDTYQFPGINAEGTTILTTGSQRNDYPYHARCPSAQLNLTQSIGRILGRLYYSHGLSGSGSGGRRGNSDQIYFFSSQINNDSTSPVQNIYSHDVTATKPFHDSGALATGDGTIVLNGDAHIVSGFPKMLKIDMTGTGIVGVSTYRLKRRTSFGFVNNTYEDRLERAPFLNNNDNWMGTSLGPHSSGVPVTNIHTREDVFAPTFDREPGIPTIPLTDTKVVMWDKAFVGFSDITTGERVFIDNNTAGVTFTEIFNVEVSPTQETWVATDDGLYRCSLDFQTIIKFDNTHVSLTSFTSSTARAVGYGNGKIWAVFDEGLVSSSDNGTTWTIFNGASTPAWNFTNDQVVKISCDQNHADDRIAVVVNSLFGTGYQFDLFWWDGVNGLHANSMNNVHNNGTQQVYRIARHMYHVITASPDEADLWGYIKDSGLELIRFGQAIPFATQTPPNSSNQSNKMAHGWTKDLAGNSAMVGYYGEASLYGPVMIKQDNTIVSVNISSTNNTGEYDTLKCIMPNGVFLLVPNARGDWGTIVPGDPTSDTAGEFENMVWEDYGWDGVNWVKDDPGSKTTHATLESTLEGITLSFDDNAGAATFNVTDYFTCGIMTAIWADGAVEFDHEAPIIYYKAIKRNQSSLSAATIPAGTTSPTWANSIEPYFATIFLTQSEASGGKLLGTWTPDLRVNAYQSDIYSRSGVTSSANTIQDIANSGGGWRTNEQVEPGEDFRLTFNVSQTYSQLILGVKDTAQRLTTIDNVVDYGLYVNGTSVTVRENGITLFTFPNATSTSVDVESLQIERIGTTVSYYTLDTSSAPRMFPTRTLQYTSLVPSTVSMMVQCQVDSSRGVFHRIFLQKHIPGTFLTFGNGITDGIDEPNFSCILGKDYNNLVVTVDGLIATNIGINNLDTTLAAGEFSVLPFAGKIRLSAADAGKSISANYSTMINT